MLGRCRAAPDLSAVYLRIDWIRANSAGGTGNVKDVGKENLAAILSIVTIGAALSFGVAKAIAADDSPRIKSSGACAGEEAADPRLSIGPRRPNRR